MWQQLYCRFGYNRSMALAVTRASCGLAHPMSAKENTLLCGSELRYEHTIGENDRHHSHRDSAGARRSPVSHVP